ncbi:MAG: hypothetical protein AAGF90_03130 [Pseudomonadota bacterium]
MSCCGGPDLGRFAVETARARAVAGRARPSLFRRILRRLFGA